MESEGATGQLRLKLYPFWLVEPFKQPENGGWDILEGDDEICFEHIEFEVPVGHPRTMGKWKCGFGPQVERSNVDVKFIGINTDMN